MSSESTKTLKQEQKKNWQSEIEGITCTDNRSSRTQGHVFTNQKRLKM